MNSYWHGKHIGKRCEGMERAEQLSPERYNDIVAMYNRYVERWNDVECNHHLPTGLHEPAIGELTIVGGTNTCFIGWGKRFIIFVYPNARRYRIFGRNPLDSGRFPITSMDEIRAIEVHYAAGVSNDALDEWLAEEYRLYGKVNRYASVFEYLRRVGIRPYETQELLDLLTKIVDLREQNKYGEARALFNGLTIDHLPKVEFGTCLGVVFDADGFLFYVDHDWGNEYGDAFIYDFIHALDPTQPDGRRYLAHLEVEDDDDQDSFCTSDLTS